MSKQKSLYEAHITNDKRAFNKAEKRLLKRIAIINSKEKMKGNKKCLA